jgi:hypothetical protein
MIVHHKMGFNAGPEPINTEEAVNAVADLMLSFAEAVALHGPTCDCASEDTCEGAVLTVEEAKAFVKSQKDQEVADYRAWLFDPNRDMDNRPPRPEQNRSAAIQVGDGDLLQVFERWCGANGYSTAEIMSWMIDYFMFEGDPPPTLRGLVERDRLA